MCMFMEGVAGGSYSCLHFNFGNHSLLMKTNQTNLVMLIIFLNIKEPKCSSQSGDHLKKDFAKLGYKLNMIVFIIKNSPIICLLVGTYCRDLANCNLYCSRYDKFVPF